MTIISSLRVVKACCVAKKGERSDPSRDLQWPFLVDQRGVLVTRIGVWRTACPTSRIPKPKSVPSLPLWTMRRVAEFDVGCLGSAKRRTSLA